MRQFIQIVNESLQDRERIDAALNEVLLYIRDNRQPDDWHATAAVLREIGYQEPVGQNDFYRVLFHKITDADKAAHQTLGELYSEIEREIRFDLNRVQGFTTTFDKVVDFIHGQFNIQWYRHEWPTQARDKPISDHGHHNLAVIYRIATAPSRILWSMQGLIDLFSRVPSTGPAYDELREVLTDDWTGYGGDDEIVIDTSEGAKVTAMTFYDTEEHGLDD